MKNIQKWPTEKRKQKNLKVGVFGSRSLTTQKDYEFIKKEIIKLREENEVIIVTSGEIKGICESARKIAQELKMPLVLYFYDFEKYNKGAYERRSKEIIKEADFFLIFHDGQSKGTKNELRLLEKQNKKYLYFKLEKSNDLNEDYNLDFTDINGKRNKC